jgi:DNA-binding response OmpR family regulator
MQITAPKKILILEDEKPMARALELKLTHAGFETRVAFNGEEGLSYLGKESFDLILLDLVMPKMGGLAFLEAMKKDSKTPVIVMSNLSQAEDERRARDLGAQDFFIKSDVPIANIVERITQFLK